MDNNDDRKPAPSVVSPAEILNGYRAIEDHETLSLMFGNDAPTSAPVQAECERLQASYAARTDTATGAAVPTPPEITDAHAARVAQLEADNDTLARLLGIASDEIAALRNQRESVMRQNGELMARVGQLQAENVALLNQRVGFIADGESFDSVDATFAVLRARALESQGARVGIRFTRRADGVIDGTQLGILSLAPGMDIGGEMAVTDGGDVAEWKEAA